MTKLPHEIVKQPDPRCPPTRMDLLAMGPDCCRHGYLGCIIANNGTPAEVQARNFLKFLRLANEQQFAGRTADLTVEQFQELWAGLEAWEKTNKVVMPAPIPDITRR